MRVPETRALIGRDIVNHRRGALFRRVRDALVEVHAERVADARGAEEHEAVRELGVETERGDAARAVCGWWVGGWVGCGWGGWVWWGVGGWMDGMEEYGM